MTSRDRYPRVSNTFYEGTPSLLREQIKWCFLHRVGPGSLPIQDEGTIAGAGMPSKSPHSESVAIISPHAGFVYSGPIAAHGYLRLSAEQRPDVAVIIGPNHTGYGAGVSVWGGGGWLTPLGRLEVDGGIAKEISALGAAELDEDAHVDEHSVEVQLPFLQFIYGNGIRIVPVCMMLQDYASSRELGIAIAGALKGRRAVVIASTDFSHYVPYKEAYRKDSIAGEAILRMDPRAVESAVVREGISMCGPGPVMAALAAALSMGAESCERLCYATSGDTSGDRGSVVGYGSFVMRRPPMPQ